MIRVLLLVVLIHKTFALDSSKGKSCIAPYGENGTCVSLAECPDILSVLGSDANLGQQLLKDSYCNCDMPEVCCGIFNKKKYTPLINCAPPPEPDIILLSDVSDRLACGLHSSTDRIKGGSVVKFGEFPWIAAIEYQSIYTNESAGLRSAGSIINRRYILTAAHSIVNIEFVITQVWLGLFNTTTEKYCRNINSKLQCIDTVQKMNVEDAIPHEFYNRFDGFNNIGLLRLEKDIEFTEFVRPICLPSADSESLRTGTYLTVTGWGTTEHEKSSEIKLKVELPLEDNNICNKYLKKMDTEITSKQLCVGGERGKDACQGDSGGPLMYDVVGVNGVVQWYQQGIVSYGVGCGTEGRPAVYTKVSSYARWISNKVNDRVNSDLGIDEPCTTADRSVGSCVPLTTCEEVSKAVATKNLRGFRTAIDSHCGHNNYDEALVCCENPGSSIIPNLNSTALPDKTTCGILKTEPRIDGTEIKDLAEFPWVAGIEFYHKHSNVNEIRCIGTVINNRYVLTSADCIVKGKFVPVNVWLGHWNTSAYNNCKGTVNCTNTVQKIKTKTTILHPFFLVSRGSYDIALVLLENEIRFTDYISPICLPSPSLPSVKNGTQMLVLSWTKEVTTEFVTTSDMILKEEIFLIENGECNMLLTAQSRRSLNSLKMCARGEGNQSCNRLLGAPLMRSYEDNVTRRTQWYLEGLVSFIADECNSEVELFKGYPGSYTRVIGYLDWIVTIISED